VVLFKEVKVANGSFKTWGKYKHFFTSQEFGRRNVKKLIFLNLVVYQ